MKGKGISEALFIISSPFQAICALEAIDYYKITSPHILLFDTPIIRKMTYPILQDHGETCFLKVTGGGTLAIIKALLKQLNRNKYDIIFIGDYFSYFHYVTALFMSKRHARYIYLDDGNSTLTIMPPSSRQRGRSKRERKYLQIWDFFSNVKTIKKSFFSIYDLGEEFPFDVEKNTLSSFVGNNVNVQSGIYVIGTDSSFLHLKDRTYSDYLKALDKYIKESYGEENVYYCPHRRDENDFHQLVDELGWHYRDSEYGVEIDFLRKNIYPLLVVGFGSTALYTLKKIFSKTSIETIYIVFVEDHMNNAYRAIEKEFSQYGIRTIFI